jgi:hypothetical protein
MGKGIAAWGEKFSLLIFRKHYAETTHEERLFVHFHIHQYEAYRKNIIQFLTRPGGPMHGKKIPGRQYDCLFCFYRNRISRYHVYRGIADAATYAQRQGKEINSIRYFRRAIHRAWLAAKTSPLNIGGHSFTEHGRDPFMFKVYCDFMSGYYSDCNRFDGVEGPNNSCGIERPGMYQ